MTGLWITAEDNNFASGDSPVEIDIFDKLTAGKSYRTAEGYITCDGPGSIQIEIAETPNEYGGAATVKAGESLGLSKSRVAIIKITHLGTDSAYRVVVVPIN
ncbi:MAG: hypothetical protein V3U27_21555 [Candidatus Tectomicrobia bacterium]